MATVARRWKKRGQRKWGCVHALASVATTTMSIDNANVATVARRWKKRGQRQTMAIAAHASHLDDYWQCDRFLPVAIGRDSAVFKIGIDQVVKDIALTCFVAEFFDRGTDLVER